MMASTSTNSIQVRHLIHTLKQVTRVTPVNRNDAHTAWSVQYQDVKTKEVSHKQYDAVVINSGHHEDCYIPDIEGIAAWQDKYPKSIRHSKHFRRPEEYTGMVIFHASHPNQKTC